MIKKDLVSKVEGVTSELDKLENHYRAEVDKSFEISDLNLFQKKQASIHKEVQNIKLWKRKVNELKLLISGTELGEAEPEKPEPEKPEPEESYKIKDDNYKGIITLKMFNKTYRFTEWSDVLIKVFQVISVSKPYIIAKLEHEKSLENNGMENFSHSKDDIKRRPKKLHNGMWVEADRNKDEILEVVETLRVLSGYDKENILIEWQ